MVAVGRNRIPFVGNQQIAKAENIDLIAHLALQLVDEAVARVMPWRRLVLGCNDGKQAGLRCRLHLQILEGHEICPRQRLWLQPGPDHPRQSLLIIEDVRVIKVAMAGQHRPELPDEARRIRFDIRRLAGHQEGVFRRTTRHLLTRQAVQHDPEVALIDFLIDDESAITPRASLTGCLPQQRPGRKIGRDLNRNHHSASMSR